MSFVLFDVMIEAESIAILSLLFDGPGPAVVEILIAPLLPTLTPGAVFNLMIDPEAPEDDKLIAPPAVISVPSSLSS